MKYIVLTIGSGLSLLSLYFLLCFIPSCSTNHPEGRYLMIKKGYYSQLDFKDDENVIIVDNLGYGMSFSCTYKIFDNKIHIKTDKGDLIYDIQEDVISPAKEGNGPYTDLIGTFAKEGSKTYKDALKELKQQVTHIPNQPEEESIKFKKEESNEDEPYDDAGEYTEDDFKNDSAK